MMKACFNSGCTLSDLDEKGFWTSVKEVVKSISNDHKFKKKTRIYGESENIWGSDHVSMGPLAELLLRELASIPTTKAHHHHAW
jgi:hypothetical protein